MCNGMWLLLAPYTIATAACTRVCFPSVRAHGPGLSAFGRYTDLPSRQTKLPVADRGVAPSIMPQSETVSACNRKQSQAIVRHMRRVVWVVASVPAEAAHVWHVAHAPRVVTTVCHVERVAACGEASSGPLTHFIRTMGPDHGHSGRDAHFSRRRSPPVT